MTRRLMPAMAALAAVLLWVAGLAIPSADAAGGDGSCLLQRQPGAATPRQDKHDLRGESESLKGCLAFIHIPKAMGGSIELSRLHAWGVPFNRTDGCQWQLRKHGTESVRKQRQEPGALWGSCDAGIPCTHVDLNEKYGNTCSQPSLFSGKRCSAWHFPPSFDSRLASYYTETCDSFCVVRHPLERFISQYRHIRQVGKYEGYKSYGKHPCDAKHLERFANETLKELNLEQDCHLVPQVYYIFQEGNPEDRRLCRHVLNMTDAAEQFPKLMQRYGLEHVTLGGHDHLYHDRCEKIVPTAKTIELVKQFYRQDYAAFGFV